MGNSESTEQSPPGHDEERGSSAGVAADGGGEGSGDERGLSRAKSRLEELEAEPAPKPQTSLLEDLQVWWAELDLEAAAKDLLDDIEAAITGCRSLANVRACMCCVYARARACARACARAWVSG
jgi:hypothetical protein|eukprot:SAG25_NODE_91_length_16078_cov_7.663058_17_plen_124_part_00